MAIIGSVFALLGRFAGRVVNALLGWATLLLFGRVEARKQTVLGFVALASLGWVAAVFGVLLPDVGTFLVAAVPRPEFVDESLVRLGMLLAVMVVPLAVGVTGVWLLDPEARPRGTDLAKAVLRGYPFTALLAAMIAFLAVVAGWRKVGSLAKRWSNTHVPLIVKPDSYEAVVTELTDVLRRSGLENARKPAPDVLLLPARLLDRVAGRDLGTMVPDRLALIVAPGLEILVYPTDVVISGRREQVAYARAAIVSRLLHAPAWLTVSAEAQSIEDRIESLARVPSRSARTAALAEIDRDLASSVVPYEEWETLYRLRLQVAVEPAVPVQPLVVVEPAVAAMSIQAPTSLPIRTDRWSGRLVDAGLGLGVLALLAIDVFLLVTGRAKPERGQRG
jgi:hypothetical protein